MRWDPCPFIEIALRIAERGNDLAFDEYGSANLGRCSRRRAIRTSAQR